MTALTKSEVTAETVSNRRIDSPLEKKVKKLQTYLKKDKMRTITVQSTDTLSALMLHTNHQGVKMTGRKTGHWNNE